MSIHLRFHAGVDRAAGARSTVRDADAGAFLAGDDRTVAARNGRQPAPSGSHAGGSV